MKKLILYTLLLLCIVLPVYGDPGYHQGFYSKQRGGIPANSNLLKGLTGCWPPSLGVTGTVLRDVSGYANHSNTFIDTPSWVATEKGYAIDYTTGTGSEEVRIADNVRLDSAKITALVWFRRSSSGNIGSTEWILNRYDQADNPGRFGIGLEATTEAYRIDIPFVEGNVIDSTVAIQDTDWHLVVLTLVGQDFVLYHDGFQIESQTSTGTPVNAGSLNIGKLVAGGSPLDFNGDVGLVAIYNRILTPNEVVQHYNDSHALFRLKRRVYKAPAVAPSTRRIMLISQYINKLIEQCYMYN